MSKPALLIELYSNTIQLVAEWNRVRHIDVVVENDDDGGDGDYDVDDDGEQSLFSLLLS